MDQDTHQPPISISCVCAHVNFIINFNGFLIPMMFNQIRYHMVNIDISNIISAYECHFSVKNPIWMLLSCRRSRFFFLHSLWLIRILVLGPNFLKYQTGTDIFKEVHHLYLVCITRYMEKKVSL